MWSRFWESFMKVFSTNWPKFDSVSAAKKQFLILYNESVSFLSRFPSVSFAFFNRFEHRSLILKTSIDFKLFLRLYLIISIILSTWQYLFKVKQNRYNISSSNIVSMTQDLGKQWRCKEKAAVNLQFCCSVCSSSHDPFFQHDDFIQQLSGFVTTLEMKPVEISKTDIG